MLERKFVFFYDRYGISRLIYRFRENIFNAILKPLVGSQIIIISIQQI